jgi:hypothetical protein
MLRLKGRDEIIYNAFLICLVAGCEEEALKLWATETSIIDVCEAHFKQLQSEKYST